MNYIYMSEDNMYALLHSDNSDLVLFKVGYSKHPIARGGQLKQSAKRCGITQEVNMCIRNHFIQACENKVRTRAIERYVISKVAKCQSAVLLSREFFSISIEDRAYCYEHLEQWVREAKKIYAADAL